MNSRNVKALIKIDEYISIYLLNCMMNGKVVSKYELYEIECIQHNTRTPRPAKHI